MNMKRHFFILSVLALAGLAFSSCRSTSGAHGMGASITSNTTVNSVNMYNLDISDVPMEYVIDVTTREGAAKLNKLSLKEAEELALREAVIKHKCALIFNPQYTYIKKGDRILRVRIYGFPAVYKK